MNRRTFSLLPVGWFGTAPSQPAGMTDLDQILYNQALIMAALANMMPATWAAYPPLSDGEEKELRMKLIVRAKGVEEYAYRNMKVPTK